MDEPSPISSNQPGDAPGFPKVPSTRLAREIISMVLAALIFAASVWTSVFGMSGQFGPTHEAGVMLAGVGNHE